MHLNAFINYLHAYLQQTTSTTVEYAVVDKSKKKKASQEEQKPFADYDYPPVHIQYSCEKEVPQGEHNPFADYDYPPVVNKVAPVRVQLYVCILHNYYYHN